MADITQLFPTKQRPVTDFDWCYYPNCPDHTSPTGAPKRIKPTHGELLKHSDDERRHYCYTRPLVHERVKAEILELMISSQTEGEIMMAYKIAEHAGMCWWSANERDWQWKN